MTVLVTGATGFIGRYLLAQLTADGTMVLSLMRRPEAIAQLREKVTELGGVGHLITPIHGDLAAPNLGIQGEAPVFDTVVHLGAAFSWRLNPELARSTNVEGALNVTRLAHRHGARLVMVSGFMLANEAHLAHLAIDAEAPDRTNWKHVYKKAGAYEASKIEGALRSRTLAAREGLDYVEVQPGTVSGHSTTGALDPAQPLYMLINNVASGRMALVPGTPGHWMPLVSVDALAALIAVAATAEKAPKHLIALDPQTPTLLELLTRVAKRLGRTPPKRHIPMRVLAWILRIPGMQQLMNTPRETLHFLQPTRFDTRMTEEFRQTHDVEWPPITDSIDAAVDYWQHVESRPTQP